MLFLRRLLGRRPKLTAAEIIDGSVEAGDYRTAALFMIAAGAQLLQEIHDAVPADLPEETRRARTLALALDRVTSG